MSPTLDPAGPPLAGKTAFVTGGGRRLGLGAAICDEPAIAARRTPHYIVGRVDDAAAIAARMTVRCHPEVFA